MYIPTTDGKNHINIYSKGWTELGRFLSNFANCSIATEDGPFNSIEGYWYWLSTRDDSLRTLYGYNAKKIGNKLTKHFILLQHDFQEKIRQACWIKLHTNPQMLFKFKQSVLPFTHYYTFNDKIVDGGHKWILNMWTYFRTYIQNDYR